MQTPGAYPLNRSSPPNDAAKRRRSATSMSIDPHQNAPPNRARSASLPENNVGKSDMSSEERSNHHNGSKHQRRQPSLDPSVYFMSDPDLSEEEEELTNIGSSQMDHQKKLLYRSRLREFDALSVGDTSLSSSNMSPTPQKFRLSNIGKVRDKLKAASARLSSFSLQSETTSDSKTNGDNDKEYSPLDSGGTADDMLQAALLPPSLSSGSHQNTNTFKTSPMHHFSGEGQRMLSDGGPPQMPNFGGRRHDDEQLMGTEDSLSSTDSVQGISISPPYTTEQCGGESSLQSSAGTSDRPPIIPHRPRPIGDLGEGGKNPIKHSPHQRSEKSQPEADMAKRAKRKNNSHRRTRSGDAVAANIMNSGRDDWIGMGRDNIPMPEGSEDEGSLLAARTESHSSSWGNESFPPPANSLGRNTSGGTIGGYSADASEMPTTSRRSIPGQTSQQPQQYLQRSNSVLSSDTFDFSDSAAGSATRCIRSFSYDHPSHDRQSWERNHVRYASHVGIPTSYQNNNMMLNNQVPDGYGPKHGSYESTSSSGSSYMSSSYTDDSERTRERKVKFAASPATKFDKLMNRVNNVLERPILPEVDTKKEMPLFYCPNCKTKQRDFINFATAGATYEAQGYLAVYFALYLVSTLCVFGLEEGWAPLDCVYFSLITLTTTGLGDFVPSSDGAKILCACFIFLGVSTIGLLLGGLLAGHYDDARSQEAREAQIRDCPNCSRLERMKRRSNANINNSFNVQSGYQEPENASYTTLSESSAENVGLDLFETTQEAPNKASAGIQRPKIHTRHMSIDVAGGNLFGASKPIPFRRTGSGNLPPPIDESTPFLGTPAHASNLEAGNMAPNAFEMRSCESYSSSSTNTDSSTINLSKPMTRVKAAKFIILTLKQALVNSSFIIAAGSFGFYYIEKLSPVDSFYFATVLLTTVGYGDIVPVTTGGRIFAAIFVVVAGTVLLHNMSLISMIPLELRKRRIEHAVLGQFGDQLTDDELRELSTGRLVNRLKLATNRPDGLEECTREMFSLAMLVRLGRITEDDVKATFAAFRRLDHGNYGTLNSRTIIEGELMRRKSLRNLAAMSPEECEEWQQPSQFSRESMSQEQEGYAATDYNNMVHRNSPHPYMTPPLTLRRKPSEDSYYSQGAMSYDSNFDYDAYERWASSFKPYQYSPRLPRGNTNRSA